MNYYPVTDGQTDRQKAMHMSPSVHIALLQKNLSKSVIRSFENDDYLGHSQYILQSTRPPDM